MVIGKQDFYGPCSMAPDDAQFVAREAVYMSNFQEKANFIWSVADAVLRDDIKRGKYPDVILPFTVLRRLDCVLAPTKEKVLERHQTLKARGLENVDGQLRRAAGYAFYNISPFDFPKLLDDPKNIAKNLRAYINGFSENMREVIDKFKLRATIDTLAEKGLLFLLIQKFSNVELHPDEVDNHAMGTIFEELIRRFNEQSNENPGEHFTPREVIRLMVRLLINGDTVEIRKPGVVRTVFDPACGTGGMLSIAKEYVLGRINPDADIRLFGQEVNDETYAVCKSDMLIKGDDRDADNIKPESCLSKDGHAGVSFDYLLCNPPYGKDWKKDKDFISEEERRGHKGRFGAGTPRISDGQLLFLQHMISKMKPVTEGGSRIAIVMNGSPLFTGDAGSGESEIRRWILENDWLSAIVALPEYIFYNTGIPTYVWVLTNRKEEKRVGKVQLIDATGFWTPSKRGLGDKRRDVSAEQIDEIMCIYEAFTHNGCSQIFDTTDFGYRKITIERPLRLNFQASPERIARLHEQSGFIQLAISKKRGEAGAAEAEEGRLEQQAIIEVLSTLDSTICYKDRGQFEKVLSAVLGGAEVKVSAPVRKAILAALSERDATAEICYDKDGHPEADPELRDNECVPLEDDIYGYFDREVRPHVPDAWVNADVRDSKDGEIGKVGYEINFNRYFYQYEPPRPLNVIDADIERLEGEILNMLREIRG